MKKFHSDPTNRPDIRPGHPLHHGTSGALV